MIMTPSSFSYEYLSSLKFKDLQKLSAQFHVNKRWAKKQELIENLLALKEKDEATADNKQEDESEWRNGSTVFSDSNLNNESEMRRLTFNIRKKFKSKNVNSHVTLEMPQNDNNLCDQTIPCRETYDIAPKRIDLDVEHLSDSRATFDIPPNTKLIENADSRATFEVCQSETKLLEESEIKSKNEKCKNKCDVNVKKVKNIAIKQNLKSMKFDLKIKNRKTEKCEKAMTQVKTLTVPCARVTKRNKVEEVSKTNSSLIKLSNKSINIKKSTRIPVGKCDLIKSPVFSIKSSVNKKTVIKTLSKTESTEIIQTEMPTGIQCTDKKIKHIEKVGISDKENSKTVLKAKISKSNNDECNNKTSGKVNFKTSETSKVLRKTLLKDACEGKLNLSTAQTPGNKLAIKPITLIKMPDFNKIHKRQFEQMDSLPDYLRKREERIKKLFGTPQPGQQLQASSKSGQVFHFQSAVLEKDSKESTTSKIVATKKKECESKIAQKEAFKCKLPPLKLRADIKDKNRSHIHGVRTNKRFELQMKFRKM